MPQIPCSPPRRRETMDDGAAMGSYSLIQNIDENGPFEPTCQNA